MNNLRSISMAVIVAGLLLNLAPSAPAYQLGPEVSIGYWGILPDADADPYGDILLLYGENGALYYSKLHNGVISEREEVGGVNHIAILYKDQDPRIAADMDGNPHIVWTPQVSWYASCTVISMEPVGIRLLSGMNGPKKRISMWIPITGIMSFFMRLIRLQHDISGRTWRYRDNEIDHG